MIVVNVYTGHTLTDRRRIEIETDPIRLAEVRCERERQEDIKRFRRCEARGGIWGASPRSDRIGP